MDILLNLMFFTFIGYQILVIMPNIDETTEPRYGVLLALVFAIIATSIITIHSVIIVVFIAYYLLMLWSDSLDKAD